MLDANIRNRHLDDVRALRDPGYLFVSSDRRKAVGHGFIQLDRHDLDDVQDAIPVLDS